MVIWPVNYKITDLYMCLSFYYQINFKWTFRSFRLISILYQLKTVTTNVYSTMALILSLQVDKKLFEQALLKLNREEFVEIFLDHGFLIHKYLNHKKYKLLYEKADDREFFVSICQEKVLGQMGVSTCCIATTVLLYLWLVLLWPLRS